MRWFEKYAQPETNRINPEIVSDRTREIRNLIEQRRDEIPDTISEDTQRYDVAPETRQSEPLTETANPLSQKDTSFLNGTVETLSTALVFLNSNNVEQAKIYIQKAIGDVRDARDKFMDLEQLLMVSFANTRAKLFQK